MSPIIHAGTGWLLGAWLPRRRDRVLATIAAVIPDVDGLTLLFGEEMYAEWHHKIAHGAVAAVVVAALAFALSRAWRTALVALAAFHAHVAMDLAGSGPGWPILYWWPFADTEWLPSWQWDLASWQNSLFGFIVVVACLAAALPLSRTPVEVFSQRGDAAVVRTIRARFARGGGATRRCRSDDDDAS